MTKYIQLALDLNLISRSVFVYREWEIEISESKMLLLPDRISSQRYSNKQFVEDWYEQRYWQSSIWQPGHKQSGTKVIGPYSGCVCEHEVIVCTQSYIDKVVFGDRTK